MVGDAEHGEPVLGLLNLLALLLLRHYLSYQLVLDEDQRLHRVLQGQFVLAHLTEDGANVQVDVCWVQHL